MMKKKQVKNRECLSNLLIIVAAVIGYFLYSKATFPIDLNGREPEFFNSSQSQNLKNHIISNQSLKESILLKNKLFKNCQDLQISKNNLIYCGTGQGNLVQIDKNKNYSIKILAQRKGGIIYGLRLSLDQKTLYFMNHDQGLCSINLQSFQTSLLVGQYKGQKLVALNSIQVHPQLKNILYFTQSSYLFPMKLHQKDVLLGNPLGRLFEFNLDTNQLKLVFQGLYFANGLVFQKYKGEQTILVAESNRYRIQRIFIQGQKYGTNMTVIQNLPIFLDNMKQNQKGQIWIGGPVMRNHFSTFSENNPWIRKLILLLPSWLIDLLVDKSLMGGVKISFSKQLQATSSNYIFQSLKGFNFITCIIQRENMVYFSSLISEGILIVPAQNIKPKLSQQQKEKQFEQL